VYAVVIPVNIVGGFFWAGISVALNTLVYKVTPSVGRSVQFAVYSTIVTLVAAPMPVLGGYLPDWLNALGIHADLRVTFYASCLSFVAAAIAGRYITEPQSRHTREMVKNLFVHLWNPESLQRAESGEPTFVVVENGKEKE
jgi:MFS family permease